MSPNGRILSAMLDATLHFVLSEALLAEYRRVLLRPNIAEGRGLAEAEVETILEELVLNAVFRERLPAGAETFALGSDVLVPGDEHVVALLTAAPEAVLVTGDRRLREAIASRRPAFTPAQLISVLWPD